MIVANAGAKNISHPAILSVIIQHSDYFTMPCKEVGIRPLKKRYFLFSTLASPHAGLRADRTLG